MSWFSIKIEKLRSGQPSLRAAVRNQRDRWVLWYPVAFTAGITTYFLLPREPAIGVMAVGAALLLACLFLNIKAQGSFRIILVGFILAGFVTAMFRVETLDTKMLLASTPTSQFTGWIEKAEQTSAKRTRLWIHLTTSREVKAENLPDMVRISGKKIEKALFYGDKIVFRGRLFPLPGPVKPRGFDFGRHLWFQGIGATGFYYGDVKKVAVKQQNNFSPKRQLQIVRYEIGKRIDDKLAGQSGALAKALIIGDRGGVDKKTTQALRKAGLAHILAISGLHMSLVAGGVFWLLRAVLATSRFLALNFAIKKWAAIAGIFAAGFYLLISGFGIATQRAFIMATIMFLAILFDRTALSLRNVATAAFIVTIIHPEAIVSASFQMSFMAVVGLIAVYEQLRVWRAKRKTFNGQKPPLFRTLKKTTMFFASIAATTMIASIFTGLPAAFHFHKIAVFSLLGNIVALPVVSLLVMPGAILTMLLMPIGLEAIGLQIMEFGIRWVITHAKFVTALPNSQIIVPDQNLTATLLIAFGMLWICLWRGRLKLVGSVPIIAGFFAIGLVTHPDILISKFGRNVAVLGSNKLLVFADGRKSRYAGERWLTSAGDAASVKQAAARTGWDCKQSICRTKISGKRIIYLKRKAIFDSKLCKTTDILISAEPLRKKCSTENSNPKLVKIDRIDLWREGAHALYFGTDKSITKETSLSYRGNRPWVVVPIARKHILINPEKHKWKYNKPKQKKFWKKVPKPPVIKPRPKSEKDA